MRTLITLAFALALIALASTQSCDAYEAYLDDNAKGALLTFHNQLRQYVASGSLSGFPSAANMERMYWDENLASQAQNWANNCQFQHSGGSYGENLAYKSSSQQISFDTNNIREMVIDWFNEYQQCSPSEVDYFNNGSGNVVGHFTQEIWATSNRLGCGGVAYNDGGWYTMLLVCQYLEQGNYMQQPIYESGSPCSNCANGGSCDNEYTSLCSDGSGELIYKHKLDLQLQSPSQEFIKQFQNESTTHSSVKTSTHKFNSTKAYYKSHKKQN